MTHRVLSSHAWALIELEVSGYPRKFQVLPLHNQIGRARPGRSHRRLALCRVVDTASAAAAAPRADARCSLLTQSPSLPHLRAVPATEKPRHWFSVCVCVLYSRVEVAPNPPLPLARLRAHDRDVCVWTGQYANLTHSILHVDLSFPRRLDDALLNSRRGICIITFSVERARKQIPGPTGLVEVRE